MIDPEDWLQIYAPGYAALRDSERKAITHFCLLWSLFEAQKFANNANAKRICDEVTRWEHRGLLDLARFNEPLAYFTNRYFSGGIFTGHFADLHFRPADHRGIVENVLAGGSHNAGDIVRALLLIAYRLRNNLFHGMKWTDELREQENNFANGSGVLIGALEISG